MTKQGREVKMTTGFGNPAATGKEFNFYDVEGLRRVFGKLETSNPKRSGKVDYWLAKNQKALDAAFGKYLEAELDVLKKYAVFETVDGVEYLVEKGKDDTDLVYFVDGAFYRKVDGKMKFEPTPFWELEVPAEEGKEAAKTKMNFEIKFREGVTVEEYSEGITSLQKEFKFDIELWPLKEEHLEGLQVMWKSYTKEGQLAEDITGFRELLYDNCIAA